MANKAKETWKNVPLHEAYQRGIEVEECNLNSLKQTWLQNLEGMALESFKMGVAKAARTSHYGCDWQHTKEILVQELIKDLLYHTNCNITELVQECIEEVDAYNRMINE